MKNDPDDRRPEFARRLKALLAKRNMSQSDLADAAQIGRDAVSTYATGRTFPKPATLRKIAEALSVEIAELAPVASADEPGWQIRQAGQQGQAWLTINRTLPMDTALAILALIREDDARGAQTG